MNKLKSIITLFFLFLIVCTTSFTKAQTTLSREKALAILLKTNRFIGHTHMAVTRGKTYTGNLGKAVQHERYAKELFLQENYQKAIQHSGKARALALEAVQANKVKPTSDAKFTEEETQLIGAITDKELEADLLKANVAILKDEDLIKNNNLGLDIK